MSVVRIAVRHLGEAVGPAVNLAVVVLLTAFVVAAAPRLLARAANTTLRTAIAAAPVDVRGLQLVGLGRVAAGGSDPLAGVEASGRTLEGEMPAAVRDLVAGRDMVVDTSRWTVTTRRVPETTVRLRVQPAAAAHLRILEGRLPSGTAGTLPAPATGAPGSGSRLAPIPVLEVALPAASARVLATHVGETLVLGLDPTNLRTPFDRATVAIEVVGIYEVSDPASEYWFGDRLLAGPSIRSLSQLSQVQDLTALVAPAEYPALVDATAFAPPLTYAWRLAVDSDRFEAASLDVVVTALRRLESIFPGSVPRFVAGADPATGAGLRSGLLGVVEAEQDRWGSAIAVLSVTGIGAAAVALAAVALSAMLLGGRGRRALATWQARGASRGQLIGGVVAEGAVLVVPATAAGTVAALVAIPGGPIGAGPFLAAGTAALGIVAVVAAAPLRTAPSDRARRRDPRRTVFEILVVGLAVAGGVLLRARGLRGASATDGPTPADPFVAAVPALFGLAAGIVALRAFPLPMRVLAALAGRRRDLVPVLALRRLTRGAVNGGILLVLLAMTTILTFAAVTLVYLDRAADAISWADVGAPFRLDSTDPAGIPDSLDPATLPGVTAWAGAFTGREIVAGRGVPIQLAAVDVADAAALAAGSPADPAFPPDLAAPGLPAATGGTPTEPVFPALVSADLASSPAALGAGSTFQLAMEAGGTVRLVSFRVVDVRASFPGMQAGASFVVASRDQLRGGLPDLALPTTRLSVHAPESEAEALRAAVATRVPGNAITVSERAVEAAAVRDSPYVRVVAGGVLLGALLAMAYALLAALAGLALSGAARAVELAHLRALGLPGGRAFGLVLLEHGPTVCLAVATGAALGVGLFAFLQPGLGLSAIIGSNVDVPLVFEPSALALALIGSLAILGCAIVVAAAAERHADPGRALRGGIE